MKPLHPTTGSLQWLLKYPHYKFVNSVGIWDIYLNSEQPGDYFAIHPTDKRSDHWVIYSGRRPTHVKFPEEVYLFCEAHRNLHS